VRRRGRWPTRYRPMPAWRRSGWDIVRTPFGERIVPRGQGLRESAKWALLRGLAWIGSAIILLIAALWIHAFIASQAHH
jgi:hypothetical protein